MSHDPDDVRHGRGCSGGVDDVTYGHGKLSALPRKSRGLAVQLGMACGMPALSPGGQHSILTVLGEYSSEMRASRPFSVAGCSPFASCACVTRAF